MNVLRRHLTAGSWVALVAALALALLPTLSHALAHARGDGGPWAVVCTPQGPQAVAADAAETGVPVQLHAALEHCPLCALAAGDGAVPPAPGFDWPVTAGAEPLQVAAATVPRSPEPWSLARPRAPPAPR